ncbi:Putative odorant receptor 92a [Trachymyrmex zeteki]|uniref:Putative odorant receptor 92a n=1 Tax=Mycetomoellerius zeteki TaxID=64791 RepID=A0A151XJD0_9HYME|nr:Putative odorant receptor 92a [Trachymyrmex zeteki]
MAEDWNDCNNDGVAVRETAGKTKLSSRICNGLIILHTIAAFAYVIGILLADADVTDRTAELPLMMKMEYPFIIDTQRKYSLVLVTQFLFVMVCSWGAGLFNALFLTLTLHVGSQINILLCWLTKIGSKDIENKHDSFVTVTTKIIRKHQKIINLSENVENLYSYIALLQFTSNIVMICSLAFLIVTAIGSPDATEQIVRSLLFYAVTNLEAFIFCFAGEYLSNKSKAIGNAAYNSAWYDMKAKDSRVLLFIILRSQRQLKLTAGKMTVLSFEAYWIIALVIDDICHCRYLLMHLHSNDLFDLMDCFSSFLTQIKLTFKLIVFWLNERKFFKILTMMAEDWNDCSGSNINMRKTASIAILANRITSVIFTLYTLAIVAYSIGILLADVDVTGKSELPLLLKVDLPVNINTKLTYKMLLTMQFVHLIMCGWGTGILNCLLLTLTLHVGGQMDILRCRLNELVPRRCNLHRTLTINRTLKLTLILCGIWPGTKCVIICRAYWIIALAIDDICLCRYLLMHLHSNNFFDLMDCFSSFLTQIKVTFKLIIFWVNERIIKSIIRRKFFEILTMMAEDWNDCAGSNINMRETACKAKLANRITNAMFTLHTLTIVAYSIGILLADVDVTGKSELPLLLKMELPVNINTKLTYKMLLTMQFVHLIMCAWGTGLLNALLLTLTLHVGGQMDILRCKLNGLVLRRNEVSESVAVKTNRIIRKHQRIINFSEYIEDLYTYIALVQFTSNTVLICSLGFLIVTASSKAIGNAAYNSAWYEMKPKNSRNLIFVTLRAQKQLTLTVGKIMDLSLQSFTNEICHCRYLLMHLHSNDFFDLMDCFSSFLAQVKFTIKLIIFWLNERKFYEILTMMAEDWNDCAGSNINMRETACKAKLANRITNAMFTLHAITIVAYSIGVFMADVDITKQSELPLLLKVELPVNINIKRTYKMLLTMQFVHLIMCGCGTGLLNALLLTLTLHVGGQMDILRCWLSELVPRGNEGTESVAAIGSPDATEHIVRSLLFYTVTNLEAFIFCYAGEYMKNKSTAIGNAVYSSAWYEMKPKNSRNLIFVILRAQKQLTLTVGKVMDLSLESFTSTCRSLRDPTNVITCPITPAPNTQQLDDPQGCISFNTSYIAFKSSELREFRVRI